MRKRLTILMMPQLASWPEPILFLFVLLYALSGIVRMLPPVAA
jgi:hypothetical protein